MGHRAKLILGAAERVFMQLRFDAQTGSPYRLV